MAMQRRFKVDHQDVFPCGAYLVSPVVPVFDFDRSTKDNKIQQVDKDTDLLLWAVDVLDADPEAGRKSKTVTVKITARVQPVPPSNSGGSPFTPVMFEGLSALPYIEESGTFSRIVWSFKAQGMAAPKAGSAAAATADSKVA